MTAIELFQEGRLREAIHKQDRFVQSHPGDAAPRLLLCELLLYDGKFDSVLEHLDRVPLTAAGMDAWLDDYRLLLKAETTRQRILASDRTDEHPRFLLPPPEHLTARLNALDRLRRGDLDGCVDSLDRADAMIEGIAGHVDGRNFDGVRDGDDLFASVLEVLHDGHYWWFPFDQVGRLQLGSRDALRDRLFVPATLSTRTGDEWRVYLPALYPATHLNEDEEVKAGQATDWFAEPGGPTRGVGLRLLTFGDEELTLLDFKMWEG